MFGHNAQTNVWWKPNNVISVQTCSCTCQSLCWRSDNLGLFWYVDTSKSLSFPLYQSRVKCKAFVLSWSWTMIPNTANLQQNGRRNRRRCCSGPDLSWTEILLWNLQKTEFIPVKLNEIKQHYQEKNIKISSQQCKRLIMSCRKRLSISSNLVLQISEQWFYLVLPHTAFAIKSSYV